MDRRSTPFLERVRDLPRLGIGVSTEYGAGDAPGALDPLALRRRLPHAAAFLEVGVEVLRGLDDGTRRWLAAGYPVTYHFLDVNLDDPADFDATWLHGVRALAGELKPAWMCGDAGLWHLGARERGQMLLLPPVLTDESATELAQGIARLRDETGLEVLPENPPGTAFVGDLHLVDFFARVAERADTGLLVDVAHLAIYQHATGRDAFDGVDRLPLERVVELHVAGGETKDQDGYRFIDDHHSTRVLDRTWALFEHIAARAPNLKAVVFECERNGIDDVVPGFERIARTWPPA